MISSSKVLPAPAADVTTPPPPATATAAVTAEEKSEPVLKVEEAAPEPTPVVNSVPKAEVKEESVPVLPRPLSPYPNVITL